MVYTVTASHKVASGADYIILPNIEYMHMNMHEWLCCMHVCMHRNAL